MDAGTGLNCAGRQAGIGGCGGIDSQSIPVHNTPQRA